MERNEIENVYPLSPMQHGIAVESLKSGDDSLYITQMYLTLIEDADVDLVKKCWQVLIDKHKILRTKIVSEHSKGPLQVVYKKGKLEFNVIECEQSIEQCIESLKRNTYDKGMDIGSYPLSKFDFFVSDKEKPVLVWTHHHILLDGWSSRKILSEFATMYSQNGESADIVVNYEFKTYLDWLSRKNTELSKDYWISHLEGVETSNSDLSFCKPTTDESCGINGIDRIEYSVDSLTFKNIKEYVRSEKCTLADLIKAVYFIAAYKFTGNTDLLCGVVSSDRSAELTGSDEIVGLMINTTPLRALVDPTLSLKEFLSVLHLDGIERKLHENTPLAKIYQWADIQGGDSLINSLISIENYGSQLVSAASDDALIKHIDILEAAQYSFTLNCEVGDDFKFVAYFNERNHHRSGVIKFLEYITFLFGKYLESPDQRILTLNVLTEDKQEEVIKSWSGFETDYPQKSVVSIFETLVDQSPKATALIFEDRKISYEELNNKANQLAYQLIDYGVSTEGLVGSGFL